MYDETCAKIIAKLEAERDGWMRLAVYLADVHAANAVAAMCKKSAPKSEKRRQAGIAKLCIDGLAAGDLVGKIPSRRDGVMKRLRNAIETP